MKDENVLKMKANEFLKSNLPVHITFKKGYWKRGYIYEISDDFFMLMENLEGEMPVFFIEIKSINKFHNDKEEKET